jgi:osmotically-inducible protein OsmY
MRRLSPTGRQAHLFATAQTSLSHERNLGFVDVVIRLPMQIGRAATELQRTFMTQFARVSVLFAAVALTTLAGCASSQKHESTGQYMDDTAITAKVKTAIFNEPTLKSAEINVETFKGRVQLSGFVSSRDSINRAVAVAQGVSGVTSVGNDMRLK